MKELYPQPIQHTTKPRTKVSTFLCITAILSGTGTSDNKSRKWWHVYIVVDPLFSLKDLAERGKSRLSWKVVHPWYYMSSFVWWFWSV